MAATAEYFQACMEGKPGTTEVLPTGIAMRLPESLIDLVVKALSGAPSDDEASSSQPQQSPFSQGIRHFGGTAPPSHVVTTCKQVCCYTTIAAAG